MKALIISMKKKHATKTILFGETHFAEELGSNEARVTRLKSPESATDIAGDHWTLEKYLIKYLNICKKI